MNDTSSMLLNLHSNQCGAAVVFVRFVGPVPKVLFSVCPATVSNLTDKSVCFKWGSGKFLMDIEGAEFESVTPGAIPPSSLPKETRILTDGVRISISTAECCFVFKL